MTTRDLTTLGGWRAALADAVEDRVDLERVGGIEQYTYDLIQHTHDAVLAEILRDDALDALFARATLSAAYPRQALNLIDLAAAFKPPAAVAVLLDFLQRHLHTPVVSAEGVHRRDLRVRTLQALEVYYAAPPPMTVAAYNSYLQLLRQYATIPTHAGYSLARLLELHALSFDDATARSAVRCAAPDSMAELVERILSNNTDEQASEHLGDLYVVARTTNQLEAFQDAVTQAGGTLQPPDSIPAVQIDGRSVSLNFTTATQALALDDVNFEASLRELMNSLPETAK